MYANTFREYFIVASRRARRCLSLYSSILQVFFIQNIPGNQGNVPSRQGEYKNKPIFLELN